MVIPSSINYADNGDGGLLGNDISLTVVTAVPEPGTWVGGALAAAFAAYKQRRRFAQMLRRSKKRIL
jgi:hypothetical protein